MAVVQYFLLLIGSYARGDENVRSDCDILAINLQHRPDTFQLKRELNIPANVVTNVVYLDWEIFQRLYARGSLFLLHAFIEGKLLRGSVPEWKRLAAGFRVQQDYASELCKIRSVTNRFWELDKFGGKFLWPLVNAFPLIKNASIFRLAHARQYVFNKAQCLRLAIKERSLLMEVTSLIDFYDYANKGLPIQLPFDPNDPNCARQSLHAVALSVEGMIDEITRDFAQ